MVEFGACKFQCEYNTRIFNTGVSTLVYFYCDIVSRYSTYSFKNVTVLSGWVYIYRVSLTVIDQNKSSRGMATLTHCFTTNATNCFRLLDKCDGENNVKDVAIVIKLIMQ